MTFFLFFRGSNPPTPYFFVVLCRAKKRKKYTSIFRRFCCLKRKNRAFRRLISRPEARFCLYLPDFNPKCKKNLSCPGRQKRFLIWWERVDSNHRSETRQTYSLFPLATRELSRISYDGWSWWTDLNPRPADYKSAALPTELHQHYHIRLIPNR